MAVRAIRGAIQVGVDDRQEILDGTAELVTHVMERNSLTTDQVISVIFSATPDLRAEFPALAARSLGFQEVPLLCCTEMSVPGAMPRSGPADDARRDRSGRAADPARLLAGAAAHWLDIANGQGRSL